MQHTIVIGLLLIFGVVITLDQCRNRTSAAIAFGDRIPMTRLEASATPQQGLAELVEQKLTSQLVQQFSIDTSLSAVAAFSAEFAPEVATAEKLDSDQKSAALVADALQAVIDGEYDAESAYRDFNLQSAMPISDWIQLSKNNADPEFVASMRDFSEADPETLRTQTLESMKPIYISRSIRKSICALPENREEIAERGSTQHAPQEDPEFACAVVASRALLSILDDRVVVNDPSLEGYENYITLIDHVALGMAGTN